MREIVLDTETTGLNPSEGHRIVEIGCIELIDRLPTHRTYHRLVNPERDVPEDAFKIHGLSSELLSVEKPFREIYSEFLDFIGPDAPLIIHNAPFDMKFLNAELNKVGQKPLPAQRAIDTLVMSKNKFPGSVYSLNALCKRFKVDNSLRHKHGALLDAELLAQVYLELTGGRQNALLLHTTTSQPSKIVKAMNFSPRLKRTYPLNEAESHHHRDFLQKIKTPVWSR